MNAQGLTVAIDWWHLLGAIASLIGAFYALVKVIVAQFNKNLDIRFKAQDQVRSVAQGEWTRRFDALEEGQHTLEDRFNSHLQSLPLDYQRREDAIRQEVAIIARLDGLARLTNQRCDQLDQKVERLRS